MSTPIQQAMKAIREGTVTEVQQILARHPKLFREHGQHMLERAAKSDRVDLLPVLVAAGADVNAPSLSDTPLTAAVRKGALAAAAWLLDHGADVNGRASPKDATALHAAVMEGRMDAVRFL